MRQHSALHPDARQHGFAHAALSVTAKSVRTVTHLLTLSLSLHTGTLHADGTGLPSARSSQGKAGIDCTQAFLNEVSTFPTARAATDTGQAETLNAARKLDTACKRHPWLREVIQWKTQGMPLEVAMLWLITQPDTEIHPQWPGELTDLARMQAAATLAKSGLLPEARQLWTELSIRRPEWAEVRFNQALSLWLAGQSQSAIRHLQTAIDLCRLQACSLEPELLSHWQDRIGAQR